MDAIFYDLTHNLIFTSGVLGWFIAQVVKTIIYGGIHGTFRAERLVGSGGMPSSHSSTVCAIATTTFLTYGAGSFEFAISCFFAIVVMHDASGVRRETGKQAVILNEMMEFFSNLNDSYTTQKKLKEFVGHTPAQVFVGAVMGIVIGVLMYRLTL